MFSSGFTVRFDQVECSSALLTIAKGGGYVNAASEGHYAFLWNLVLAAQKAGSDLSVLVLAYGMSFQHTKESILKLISQSWPRKVSSRANYNRQTQRWHTCSLIEGEIRKR